ncbi:MAG: diguanylate cyclase domain-containing protein, partial [Burkholderiales bacterium]
MSGWLAERRRVARAHQDALQRMALTDSLTGLANRAAFIAELDLRCTRVDAPFALLFIDLDRFKVLNDTLGHLAADTLLVDIGKVIRASVPADAFVARPGGDEFAIIVPLADGAAHLKTLVQQLLARVATPFDLQG